MDDALGCLSEKRIVWSMCAVGFNTEMFTSFFISFLFLVVFLLFFNALY